MGIALLLAWLGMGWRLFEVQVVRADDLAEQGLAQRLVERQLAPERGKIFDRNGELLAMTVEAESIYAIPHQVEEPLYVAQQVGGLLGVDHEALAERLDSGDDFVYLDRQVDLDLADQVRRLELPGVFSHPEAVRSYPAGPVSSHVVGFVDLDGHGVEGLEYSYDELLAGTPGSQLFERDGGGRPIPQGRLEEIPAIPGEDLVTTMDLPLQYATQDACADALERTGSRECWAVVLEVETGDVLAMAGAPPFDPVTRATPSGEGFSNFVVRGSYEPGSIQKLVTMSAALEEGVVDVGTWFGAVADQIELRPGACKSATDEVYGCYADFEPHETRDMTAGEIFTISSNVGIIRIAERLPDGVLGDYIEAFGLTEPTGIDYSGETSGLLNLDPSCTVCVLSASIGYSVAASPLQMASAYAAVGNEGAWTEPRLVESMVDGEGTADVAEPATRRVVSAATSRTMLDLLAGVVETGTGGAATVPGYRVGGKTGTADKIGDDGLYTEVTRASFVGLAPIDDPKLVVAVMLDAPAWEYRTGGLGAAPVFAEVMEQALHRLGVTPDGSDE